MSLAGSDSTHLSTITEMNLDEPKRVDTGITSAASEPQAEPSQNDEQTVDHSALKTAIHAIMSNGPSSTQAESILSDEGSLLSRNRSITQPRSYEQIKESQARAKYYNQAFAVREQPNLTRERLIKTSVLTAELKTNVIIHDEFTFLTTMSSFLAARYSRPESSVMITLQHSSCMLFAGSFDPTYLLTISAVSDQIKPTMNRRNTVLIQQFLGDELLVPAERGILKFHALAEENIANGGTTLAAEISRDTKSSSTVASPKEEQAGFGLSKRLSNHKKRISNRLSPQQSMTRKETAAIPPTPPLPAPTSEVQIGAATGAGHNRSTSDATTSSDPEIDVLRGGLSQISQKALSPISTKRSIFFRKLKV